MLNKFIFHTIGVLANLIAGALIILILIILMILSSYLYLTLAQDNVLLTFEDGTVLTTEDTQKIMVNKMQVFVTDANLDLSDLEAGKEIQTVGVYQRITSQMQILLPCEIVMDSLVIPASAWASGAIIFTYDVDGEPACAIALMIVDHRSPRIPWPDAPELHRL
jgi:hypothetical protein